MSEFGDKNRRDVNRVIRPIIHVTMVEEIKRGYE